MTFRIFSNDRGKSRGIPMYSALCEAYGGSLADVEAEARLRFADCGPVKAIEWPMTSQKSKDWCLKHVGPMKAIRGRK